MKIILEEKNKNKNKINNIMSNIIESKIEKKNDISNLDLKKVVQELKDENISLREMLKEALEEINLLKNQFYDYIKKTQINNFYNSYDDTLYILDEVFKSISNDIIKSREEFALINSGIKRIFNKGINNLILKYKYNKDEKDPNIYHSKCDNLRYSLIIIKTTGNISRFGAFFQKQVNPEINNIMNFNNEMNNIMNFNPEINNIMNFNNQMNNVNNMNMNNMNNMNNINNMNMNNMNMNNINNINNMNNMNNLVRNNLNNKINQYNPNNLYPKKRNNFNMGGNNGMNGNYYINNNIMNNNDKTLNQQGNYIIFDSNSNNIPLIFSLNKKKLYYSMDSIEKSMNNPNFSIVYDIKRECFYGNENNENMNMSAGEGGTSFSTNNFSLFNLSGQKEFNIKDLEVFEIILTD